MEKILEMEDKLAGKDNNFKEMMDNIQAMSNKIKEIMDISSRVD